MDADTISDIVALARLIGKSAPDDARHAIECLCGIIEHQQKVSDLGAQVAIRGPRVTLDGIEVQTLTPDDPSSLPAGAIRQDAEELIASVGGSGAALDIMADAMTKCQEALRRVQDPAPEMISAGVEAVREVQRRAAAGYTAPDYEVAQDVWRAMVEKL